MRLEPVVAPPRGQRRREGRVAAPLRGSAGTPSPGRDRGSSQGRRPVDPPSGQSRSARRRRLAKPSSMRCHQSTPSSPSRQHSQIWRPLASAGKSIKPALDVAERDAPGVDPGHGSLHLVDDPLHPEPDEARLLVGCDRGPAGGRSGRVVGREVGGRTVGLRVLGSDVACVGVGPRCVDAGQLDQPVAHLDQLAALLAKEQQHLADIGDAGVRRVDRVEGRHRRILPAPASDPPFRASAWLQPPHRAVGLRYDACPCDSPTGCPASGPKPPSKRPPAPARSRRRAAT